MKIERECRCGARAMWEDDSINLVNRMAKHWEAEHAKCVAVPRVIQYVTTASPYPMATLEELRRQGPVTHVGG
jgi:hypothetical protein